MWLPFISGRFPFSSRSAPVGRCSAPVRVLCGPFGSRSAPIGRCSAPVWVLCGSSSSDDFILIKLPRTRRHRGNKVEQVVLVALGCVGLCWVVLGCVCPSRRLLRLKRRGWIYNLTLVGGSKFATQHPINLYPISFLNLYPIKYTFTIKPPGSKMLPWAVLFTPVKRLRQDLETNEKYIDF